MCTVLEIGLRAVPSESQPVLVVVGAPSAESTCMIYYPVYEVGPHFKWSLFWMVRFG